MADLLVFVALLFAAVVVAVVWDALDE